MIETTFNACWNLYGSLRTSVDRMIHGTVVGPAEIIEAVAKGPQETRLSKIVGKTINLWPYQAEEPQFQDGRVLVDEILLPAVTSALRMPTFKEIHSVVFDLDVSLYVWKMKCLNFIKSAGCPWVDTLKGGLPSRSSVCLAAAVLILTGACYVSVRSKVYGASQRLLHGAVVLPGVVPHVVEAVDALEQEVEQHLDGDASLFQSVRLIIKTRLAAWGLEERERILRKLNYGPSLYDQQRRMRVIMSRVAHGEDFIHGCLSTLGDFRVLSRGELYIQLNRHLLGFVRAKADSPFPLAIEEIMHLRAAVDFVCGDHIQIQVSR